MLAVMVAASTLGGLSSGEEPAPAQPVEFRVGAFTFQRPEGWNWVPTSSSMRIAQLAVKGPGGEVGDVVFFHFGPGQGGGVAANVERWLGQFSPATSQRMREVEAGGTKVTFVEAEGTFLSGMPGTPSIPMEGFSLRGAILESSAGDVFVKFTGPAAAVHPASETFEKMVLSAAEGAGR